MTDAPCQLWVNRVISRRRWARLLAPRSADLFDADLLFRVVRPAGRPASSQSSLRDNSLNRGALMVALLCFFLTLLTSPFKSRSRLEAENAALRHQLIVLQRKVRGRVHFTNSDRLFFIQLYRWLPIYPQGHHDHPARDPRALASCWLSALLVLEIPNSPVAGQRCSGLALGPAGCAHHLACAARWAA